LPTVTETCLGVDIGGSGIKSALVDVDSGSLESEYSRVETPQPATPEAVAAELMEVVSGYEHDGPIGIGFPSVVDRAGVVRTAMNIDETWVGRNVVELFSQVVGRDVTVVNDADAAAVAEGTFGVAAGVSGLVIVVTFGTGIGSGFLLNGVLAPNVELGALELDGHSPAESYFSAKARRTHDLSWDEWGGRADRFLGHVNRVFTPELIVVGGGVARKWDEYAHMIDPDLPVLPAEMGNVAGLVGAALVANGLSCK